MTLVLGWGREFGCSGARDVGDILVATVDLNGARTTYVWDSCLLVAVANPLNERTSYTYNRFKSRVTEMNPLGFVTTYTRDNMNRLTVQYRMHPQICQAIQQFYNHKLSNGRDVLRRLMAMSRGRDPQATQGS